MLGIDSVAPFRRYEYSWKILGLRFDGYKYFYGINDLLLVVLITIGYPIHIMLGFLQNRTQNEIFSNLVINVACVVCSIKVFTFRRKLRKMEEITKLMSQLDKQIRVSDLADQDYFRNVMIPTAFRYMNVYFVLYSSVSVTSILSLLVARESRLVYPAWFPFDWQASRVNYYCAIAYQYIGLFLQTVQNYANDVYGPVCLSMFTGHIHLLRRRITKLGFDWTKTPNEHQQDLITCVEDFNLLIRVYRTVQDTISQAFFTQFVGGALNIGLSLIYILFFADDVFTYAYYILQLVAMAGELFPMCYYGSVMELEFQELPYSFFLCNWLNQGHNFRRNCLTFTQLTLRKITLYSGGMVRVHVDSFFATCKMAYSIFTVIITMR